MRNLKRALSLTLASVMLLGMMIVGTSAAVSFNDADDIENVTAATILQELKIMQGSGGNFAPGETVTRGQMAIIICKMLYGDKLTVSQFADTQQFDDVPANQYYTGYVNLAANLGIISGYGNGSFGPGDPITTAQAALMLTRALGYYQNNELSGQGWAANALTAMTLATRLDIFNGLNLGVNDPLSRDNVSAMTFNTLTRATPVKFNSILSEYYTDGSSVTGGVRYIDAYEFGTKNNFTLGYTVYGMYITNKNDTDDFNRPANEWSFERGGIIGSFNDEPVKVFTSKVTSKALYDAIGKTAVDGYNFSLSLNGVSVNDYTSADLNANKNDNNDDFYNEKTGKDDLTGNGVITEVYVDGTDPDNRHVDVVVIDTYSAEVYSVKDGKITLADLIAGPAKTSDEYEAEGFAEDDVVVYTYANGKIQTVYAADKVEGEVTRVRANSKDSDGDNFNIDSTTYNYNRNMTKDRLTTDNVDNNVVAYTDANGYVVYIDEAAATYEYAYLLTANEDPDQYGGGKTVYVRLVMTDGTIKKVETDADEGALVNADVQKTTKNRIVSYSVNKNGVYSLTQRDTASATSSGTGGLVNVAARTPIFKNGRAIIDTGDGRYTTNSNTIVIVGSNEDNPDDRTFTVYTGVDNIPDITAKASGTKIDVAANEKGLAKVVYVEDADVSGVNGVIYVRADYNAKIVHGTGDNRYYEISAVVDGKLETLKVKQGSDAARILVNKGEEGDTAIPVGEDGTVTKVNVKAVNEDKTVGQWIVAVKNLTMDSNDMVTNVKFFEINNSNAGDDEDGSFWGTGTEAYKNSLVTLGNRGYNQNKNGATVVRYDTDGKFSVSTIGSIKDDSNDKWLAVTDEYGLTGVCIIEVKGGEGSGSSSQEPETNVPGTDKKLPNAEVDGGAIVIKYYGTKPSADWIMEQATKLDGRTATRYSQINNKVFFGDSDGTGVTVTLKEQIAIKIGGTIIDYMDKGNNGSDVDVGSGLNDTNVYLPKDDVVENTKKYTVSGGKITIASGTNPTADIELVQAHKLTIGSASVTLAVDNEAKTAIASARYVQDGTKVVVTGELTSGYSRLTQKIGAADATYLTGTKDGEALGGAKNTATITVDKDVTLGEVAVYKVTALGGTPGYYEVGKKVTFTTDVDADNIKAEVDGTVSGTLNGSITKASGTVEYTVDASDAHTDNTITLVEAYEVKAQTDTNIGIYTKAACASGDKVSSDTWFKADTELFVKAADSYKLTDATKALDWLTETSTDSGIYKFTVTESVAANALAADQ